MVVLLRTLAVVLGADLSSVIAAMKALAHKEAGPESNTESESDGSMPEIGKKRSRRQRKNRSDKQWRAAIPKDSAQAVRAAPDMPIIADEDMVSPPVGIIQDSWP